MIFRQETIQKQAKQIRKKKKLENNRKRNHILNFRVSDEEYELINKKIEIIQMSKQDYFIQLLTEHEISVRADYRVVDVIAKEIFQLARVIKKVGKLNEIEDETLLYILEIYEEIKKEKVFSHKDQRQDESTTWYFIPDKTILSGCTFIINQNFGGRNDRKI